ncbi:hypothetical protein [Komagataeibacter oboediens]|uniref:HEPN domain-containing protein n=2 Tax=Komagataeibacter TaxID=1434011 RepID=A0ABS5SR51_9PROT|nr:hypothetical protein [Komagataeibacter oboediens]MBL7232079.1 hypothetical protein [Komagataeibacter oboediens]MBT0676624.1 hypothetical protein [Komagataeibacter oboediens]MBT0679939.1 hypothetical protein [Komagataeibacter oboediens]
MQTGDLAEVTQTVVDLAHGRMAEGSSDLNVLLDQADSNMEMAVMSFEDGRLAFAATCAEQAASCALLVAIALRRMAKDIPPVQERH